MGLAGVLLILAISLRTQIGIGAEPAKSSLPTLTQTQLLDELRQRKFDELDRQISAHQEAFEHDVTREDDITGLFSAFAVNDFAIGDLLAEWVKSAQNSFAAHAARARYLNSAGWTERSGGYANQVPPEAFKKMAELLSEADVEAKAALKLNPNVMSSYNVLISDAQSNCNYGDLIEALDGATKAVPACHGPRYQFIETLLPQWCGSRQDLMQFAMQDTAQSFARDFQEFISQNPKISPNDTISKFAEHLERSAKQNPRLKPELEMAKFSADAQKSMIANQMLDARAMMVKWNERAEKLASQNPVVRRFDEITGGQEGYDAMEKVAKDARKFSAQNPRLNFLIGDVYVDRAEAALFEKKYDDAIKFYDQAIAKTGGCWTYYQDRAEAYYTFNSYGAALNDLNRAEKLGPNSPRTIEYRAYVLASMGNGEGPQAA
ncbi:MAG TPA: DUF4034 domain-containing protein, partial [Candidatus Binataceae bacterium]|nr:DUF4034 domain-containing protein [Candidatus Binataceae bacterium]